MTTTGYACLAVGVVGQLLGAWAAFSWPTQTTRPDEMPGQGRKEVTNGCS